MLYIILVYTGFYGLFDILVDRMDVAPPYEHINILLCRIDYKCISINNVIDHTKDTHI